MPQDLSYPRLCASVV